MTNTAVGGRRTAVVGIVGTLVLVLTACGGDGSVAARATVRDSAGVRIVENSAPAWRTTEAWHLSDVPRVDIGVVEGDPHYQFDNVTGALRLRDGRIVVANAGSGELRFYDATGTYVSTSGRKGGGPGEFQSLSSVERLGGDSLLAFDRSSRRISIFDATGHFLQAITPQQAALQLSRYVGHFEDGSFVMFASGSIMGADGKLPNGLVRPSVTYAHVTRDGALVDTIGVFRGNASFVKAKSSSGGSLLSIQITRGGLYHSPVTAVHDTTFYYGSSDAYEIGLYGADGTLRRSVRRTQPNGKVTDAVIDQMKQAALDGAKERTGTVTAQQRTQVEQRYAEQPLPETMPAYRNLLIDSEGDLWVQEYDVIPDAQPPRWTVFDPSGQMLGTVTMPVRFTPYDIGPDYILGLWRDDLDVEHVQLYELDKSATGGVDRKAIAAGGE